ncbi:MAG: Spermine synthase [Candidatus Saccharibacteria bacterium]|nr:Spermine synthase [Candidatus Saccharibacteria bacterium]
MASDNVLFEGDTQFGHYKVVDTIYDGRKARVLYSGDYQAAQSGVAQDSQSDLLFDYNQRLIEIISAVEPAHVLLIGGGAFTLPKALAEDYPDMQIDVIELDAGLLPIAKNYFDFVPSKQVRVHTGDGRKYIDTTTQTYDLIIVDAFHNSMTPRSLQTADAVKGFAHRLKPGGIVAVNAIASYYGLRSAALRRHVANLQTQFKTVDIFPASYGQSLWLPQNFVLIAHAGNRDFVPYVRFAPVAPYQATDERT